LTLVIEYGLGYVGSLGRERFRPRISRMHPQQAAGSGDGPEAPTIKLATAGKMA
jgi:hypothetical protein